MPFDDVGAGDYTGAHAYERLTAAGTTADHDATAHSMQTAQITRPSVMTVRRSELSD